MIISYETKTAIKFQTTANAACQTTALTDYCWGQHGNKNARLVTILKHFR